MRDALDACMGKPVAYRADRTLQRVSEPCVRGLAGRERVGAREGNAVSVKTSIMLYATNIAEYEVQQVV